MLIPFSFLFVEPTAAMLTDFMSRGRVPDCTWMLQIIMSSHLSALVSTGNL